MVILLSTYTTNPEPERGRLILSFPLSPCMVIKNINIYKGKVVEKRLFMVSFAVTNAFTDCHAFH